MTIVSFVRESNRIEGIFREPTITEVSAHHHFIEQATVTVEDLTELVAVLQPDARLRDSVFVSGVRVGSHIAPTSGPEIRTELQRVLTIENPWHQHVAYETLHPFTDGNGRSGRALWLWRRRGAAPLDFLHQFYYETLENVRLLSNPQISAQVTQSDSALR